MANEISEGNVLTTSILKGLHRGKNLNQIAEQLGITPQQANNIWREYLDNRMTMPFEEQQVLHLERLENLLNTATEVLEKDMDADSVESSLKILDRIEDMQATALSRKERAKDDLVQLTKQQVQILFQVVTSIQAHYRAMIEDGLQQKTYKGAKDVLLGEFQTRSQAITQSALEEVRDYED